MKTLFAFIAIFVVTSAFANLQKAPPPIATGRGTEKLVFVDFERADYKIVYDIANSSATVESQIIFDMPEAGLPIFDLINEPTALEVNGVAATSAVHQVSTVTNFRYINKFLAAGKHVMTVRHQLTDSVTFNSTQVRSAFWTSDLDDRSFLEQYLPSNLEFDQYAMRLHVNVINAKSPHEIFTNGVETNVAQNSWIVDYPAYFNTSSVYFHLTPVNVFRKLVSEHTSIDGRKIPVIIYSGGSLNGFQEQTHATLQELERDYGPFPHHKVVVYAAGSGGMEYCGATITSLYALQHELTHSYFARAVMPANGNAGWVDEAIASWRDASYRQSTVAQLRPSQMAGHSLYRRMTDRDAYSKGERFIGYLDTLFADKGGMKKFLRDFFERRHFKPFLNQEFKQELELYFNHSLDNEFNTYVLGKNMSGQGPHQDGKHEHAENPYHPKLSKKQLLDLL